MGPIRLELTDKAEAHTWMIVFRYEPVDQLAAIDLPAAADTMTPPTGSASWSDTTSAPGD